MILDYRIIFIAIFVACWVFCLERLVSKKILSKNCFWAIILGILGAASCCYLRSKGTFVCPSNPTFSLVYIFIASLFLSAISDIKEMMIPRMASIWLVPFWLIFAKLGFLEIDFFDSLFGALLGYLIPFGIAKIFKFFKGKDGLGLGDVELYSMVGAFLGFDGFSTTLLVANCSALIFVFSQYLAGYKGLFDKTIPFAPFISFGALVALFSNCIN